ncbi:hypothetical protein TNCV_2809871 [Trichonephila clavipes]|nr:hypothetical protein TNCV_2809871 [Trichonephila clavipes]
MHIIYSHIPANPHLSLVPETVGINSRFTKEVLVLTIVDNTVRFMWFVALVFKLISQSYTLALYVLNFSDEFFGEIIAMSFSAGGELMLSMTSYILKLLTKSCNWLKSFQQHLLILLAVSREIHDGKESVNCLQLDRIVALASKLSALKIVILSVRLWDRSSVSGEEALLLDDISKWQKSWCHLRKD